LEDLGTLFPDTDPQWKGVPSTTFLEETLKSIARENLRVFSVDAVLHCDRPKIQPHRQEIRERLSQLLSLPLDRVNLKGKTLEGSQTGPETIEAQVIVLLGGSEKADQTS
jgi:2-C-methyl-D-erythritol 2,4-cyclodiphosphate synthase